MEGFAGVLIDAMVVRKPIIATRHNVNDQIVEEGRVGILFQLGNIEELENSIKIFYENRYLLETCGKEALKKSRTYDVNSVMKAIFGNWK